MNANFKKTLMVTAIVVGYMVVGIGMFKAGRTHEREVWAAQQNVCELLGQLQKAGINAPYCSYNEVSGIGEVRILSQPIALQTPEVNKVLSAYTADRQYFLTWNFPRVQIVDEKTGKMFREI